MVVGNRSVNRQSQSMSFRDGWERSVFHSTTTAGGGLVGCHGLWEASLHRTRSFRTSCFRLGMTWATATSMPICSSEESGDSGDITAGKNRWAKRFTTSFSRPNQVVLFTKSVKRPRQVSMSADQPSFGRSNSCSLINWLEALPGNDRSPSSLGARVFVFFGPFEARRYSDG